MLPHSRFHAASAASSGILLVANKGDRTLGIIDPEAGKQVATVAENGNTGHEVIASPDGRTAYVPIYGDSGVGKPGSDGTNLVAIDIASRKPGGTQARCSSCSNSFFACAGSILTLSLICRVFFAAR